MNAPAIAIVGAGPAACTAAALLAQRGWPVVVFDDGRRPEMLVGESLIPAVVSLLRQLGIEERTAAISTHKPGVSFLHGAARPIHFNFAPAAPWLPTYAYNVDRLPFDALLKTRAAELGAVFIPQRAGLVVGTTPADRELSLDPPSLDAAAAVLRGRQPDFIIDATGRSRLAARLLDIPADRGPRDDVALFAHFVGFTMPEPPGQVLISRLEKGWSWRIPLPGKLSVGVVMDRAAARAAGASPEARLDHVLRSEPLMADAARHARRISPVAVYSNYQLVSRRAGGRGWAAAGDAFGFVDPMLSSGLFLAMESARLLVAALADGPIHDGVSPAIHRYERGMRRWYRDWASLIELFYDGRIFSLHEAGARMREGRPNPVQRAIDRCLGRHLACMTAGALTRSVRSRWIVRSAARWLAWNVPPPAALAIR